MVVKSKDLHLYITNPFVFKNHCNRLNGVTSIPKLAFFLKFVLVCALRFKASKSRPPEDMCGAIATDVGKDL